MYAKVKRMSDGYIFEGEVTDTEPYGEIEELIGCFVYVNDVYCTTNGSAYNVGGECISISR